MANTGDLLLRDQGNFDDVMGTSVWNFVAPVALRDVVKVDPLNDDRVIQGDSSLDPSEPVIGVVVAVNFPSAGQCVVRHIGVVDGFVGLVRGKVYILANNTVPGAIVRSNDNLDPTYPVSGVDFKQIVGIARTATKLMVMVNNTVWDVP